MPNARRGIDPTTRIESSLMVDGDFDDPGADMLKDHPGLHKVVEAITEKTVDGVGVAYDIWRRAIDFVRGQRPDRNVEVSRGNHGE